MPEFRGIHHVGLTVRDVERRADWYIRVLGLQWGWEVPDTDGRGHKIALLHPESDMRITLHEHQGSDGAPFSEYRTGLDHLAFRVENRAALEDWLRHLEELEVEHSAIKEGATGWLITFRDPDNIQFEVYTRSKE